MANCIQCGEPMHPKREEICKKHGYPMTCVPCKTGVNGKDEERKQCYTVVNGKTERSIEICNAETAEMMYKAGRRAGVGVSKGVKMNQSYDHKVFSGK